MLGQSNPIGIIFSTLFVTFIKRGGNTIQIYGFKPEIIDIIVAVIVYFSAFALLIGGIITRVKKKRNDKLAFQENVVPPTPSDPSIVDVDKIIIRRVVINSMPFFEAILKVLNGSLIFAVPLLICRPWWHVCRKNGVVNMRLKVSWFWLLLRCNFYSRDAGINKY